MTFAAVRVRGQVNVRGDIRATLEHLRLHRANHCVFLPDSSATRGMLQKAKDYITWGEVPAETIAKLILKRGRAPGAAPVDDVYVKAQSRFRSVWDLAQAIAKDEAHLSDVEGLKPILRLHPPRRGFGGVKRSFREGGALGYRGPEIVDLLDRMIGEGAAA